MEIEDDGRGIWSDGRHGVGLTTMVEWAAVLGTCTVQRGSAGAALVRAWLPAIAALVGADGE